MMMKSAKKMIPLTFSRGFGRQSPRRHSAPFSTCNSVLNKDNNTKAFLAAPHHVDSTTTLLTLSSSVSDDASSTCSTIADDDAAPLRRSCLKYKSQCESLLQKYGGSARRHRTSSPKQVSSSVQQTQEVVDEDFSEGRAAVRFGSIDIHSHEIILGDNPAVSCGPPISIDWHAFDHEHYPDMNEYEAKHDYYDGGERRLQGNELVISRFLREDMLFRNDCCGRNDMESRLKELHAIQRSRQAAARQYQNHQNHHGLWHNVLSSHREHVHNNHHIIHHGRKAPRGPRRRSSCAM